MVCRIEMIDPIIVLSLSLNYSFEVNMFPVLVLLNVSNASLILSLFISHSFLASWRVSTSS